MADLAEAPADAGLLLNDGPPCLAERTGCFRKYSSSESWCLARAVGVMPPAAAQVRQAALIILVEVALDGAPGDVGVGGDLVVSQAVALEPEDLHLAVLDAGVGVVVTVVGQGVPVVRREGDDPQDGSTLMLSPGCSPSAVYTHTLPPTIRARPGRTEYSFKAFSTRRASEQPPLTPRRSA